VAIDDNVDSHRLEQKTVWWRRDGGRQKTVCWWGPYGGGL